MAAVSLIIQASELTSLPPGPDRVKHETLTIVFATNKFHEYVYGTRFDVYNDHLPLQSIFHKPVTKAPARIRFFPSVQRYDFNMHFILGSQLVVSDALSHYSLADDESEVHEKESNQ